VRVITIQEYIRYAQGDYNTAINFLNDNKESIDYIKAAIAANEPSSAAEAMAELDEDARLALNVAPSKGGIWTLEEVAFFKSDAYVQARKDYFSSK